MHGRPYREREQKQKRRGCKMKNVALHDDDYLCFPYDTSLGLTTKPGRGLRGILPPKNCMPKLHLSGRPGKVLPAVPARQFQHYSVFLISVENKTRANHRECLRPKLTEYESWPEFTPETLPRSFPNITFLKGAIVGLILSGAFPPWSFTVKKPAGTFLRLRALDYGPLAAIYNNFKISRIRIPEPASGLSF